MDLSNILDFLHASARWVGAEVTSPGFYLQLGLMLAAGGIAFAVGSAIRSRIDMTKLAARWPTPLRMFMLVMVASTWPSRSYLLAVAAKLALAWLIIRLLTSVIRNEFVVRLVSLSAWLVAALSILGQLEPTIAALDPVSVVLGGLRLTPLLLIKLGVLLVVALWLSNVASNFAESRITK